MTTPELPLIDDIRAASRQMVRELGFMEATLAATGLSAVGGTYHHRDRHPRADDFG